MDRVEKAGLGVAAAGHVALFALLSAGFLATREPLKIKPAPLDISLVDEVGLEAQAPAVTGAPAQSVAPELGPPEDAPPPAKVEAAPAPEPVPPAPPPKPAPAAKPAAPKPQPKAPAPPAPPKPVKQASTKPAPAAPAKPAKPVIANKAVGTAVAATRPRATGGRLGSDFLKGIVAEPSPGKAQTPRAAKVDARALAGLQDAISRQIQPCADRQVDPGPGANQIVTVLNLKLNPDGTLAGTPTMVRQGGTNDENGRYARRVVDLGIAAFKGCSPLRLPAEFYSTPAGGWNNLNYVWKLR